MYNVHYVSQHNLPTPGYTCQVTGTVYTTQEEVEAAQKLLFESQDTVNGVWTPRLQLSLVDRKALYEASQE
ncbi:hypothetical protein [Lacipirellula parvula]|uniref:Uncharacterized protein n=1 Tax=Lacipirellula parvula TaxID=2650471 RepID=A0A5K7XK83_9BACT|nr:hypothetical protein [Lacipirellula parvula]BBO35541.1 hypothetical protein PLANPX_5153 [Lacipirellula parvula]